VGDVSAQRSRLLQLNLIENAQEVLAFKMEIFGKHSKGGFSRS